MAPIEVEVAVLGPPEVRGAAGVFTRSAARELVVYLALHPEGARTDVWASALWPDRSIAASTLHSTASVARRGLGRAADGSEHLPRSGRHLRLAPTVGTDVARFARLASQPDPLGWGDALRLVRGRPLEGLLLSDWAVFDGTLAEVESMVADTALRCAAHHLARGEGEEAEWQLRRGLRARPYDERLYRALFRASEVKGDLIGLRATMAELLCVVSDGRRVSVSVDPRVLVPTACTPVHPKTMALYRELERRARPASGGHPARL